MSGYKKWRVEFDASDSQSVVLRKNVADPPGYESTSGRDVVSSNSVQNQQLLEMKQAALYSRATGAAKGVAGLAFMMWMSGNQIHLFSIMMTFQGIYAPIAAILGSGEAFPARESDEGRLNMWAPRALFCLIQLGGVAFGLWKINGMGLLPTYASDYAQGLAAPKPDVFTPKSYSF